MPQKRLLPATEVIIQQISTGAKTIEDIANDANVQPAAVRKQIRHYQSTARLPWPWTIQPQHKGGWIYEALGDYLRHRGGFRVLNPRNQARLLEFLCWFAGRTDRLAVVDYDPDTPQGYYVRAPRRGDNAKNCIRVDT